jgi:predicted phosphodiesterase
MLVGVISDTHGLLRPQALDALRGSDLIIHAGDVGQPELLEPFARSRPCGSCAAMSTRAPGPRGCR